MRTADSRRYFKMISIKDKIIVQRPASDLLTEALPLGNSSLGILASGGIRRERISINEKTLWSGGPGPDRKWNYGIKEGGRSTLPQVRKLLSENKEKEGFKLANEKLTGVENHYGTYEVLGFMDIEYMNQGLFLNRDYQRTLNLNEAEEEISYSGKKGQWKRTGFCSYPANSYLRKISASEEGSLSLRLSFKSPKGRTVSQEWNPEESTLLLRGVVNENGLKYSCAVHMDINGGSISSSVKRGQPQIQISRADSVILRLCASTDYSPEGPDFRNPGQEMASLRQLELVKKKSWEELREEHRHDFQSLFTSCRLRLGQQRKDTDKRETFQRIKEYGKRNDPALAELLFDYGRYLLISSSRPGTLPANLQGIWNPVTNPPWNCDYHTNINLQMNYWMAEAAGLSSCHLPLFDYMEMLQPYGKLSSQSYYGCRGWSLQSISSPWGYVAPGWVAYWGHFPGGAAWLCRHAWEHYLYTADLDFLKNRAWPLMKEAALFWVDWLNGTGEPSDNKLVSSPSYSPEHGPFTIGSTIDHQIARDIMISTLKAAEILDEATEEGEMKEIRDTLSRLQPTLIGRHGQIQEWLQDIDDPRNKHRHISHLYGLYPAGEIDIKESPELAKAAGVTLSHRGTESSGWSIAWKGCFLARLGEGERLEHILSFLFRPSKEKRVLMHKGGGLYTNLFCAHPPFQIDGNLGYSAAVCEALLQNREDEIRLLPALPPSWSEGAIEGLKAWGNLECSLKWKDGKLTEGRFLSPEEREVNLCWPDGNMTAHLKGEEPLEIDFTKL